MISKLTCEVFASPDAIQWVRKPLAVLLRRIALPDDVARAARFFAPTRDPAYSHLVAAVSAGTDLRGVVYAYQRKALGLPVGNLYVGFEDCLDGGIIAPEQDRPDVLRTALESLLPRRTIHTMILTCDSNMELVCRKVGTLPDFSCSVTPYPKSVLRLGDSFDAFLRSLGKHTRRNLMYYRRRASTSGWCPVEALSPRELSAAIDELVDNQRTGNHSHRSLHTRCEVLKTRRMPFWSGIRSRGGAWLALVGGWQEGERALVSFQLNHGAEEFRRASLSTVMRSYLTESLVSRGVRELTFVDGCKGILEPFCNPLPFATVSIRKKGPASAVRRALFSGARDIRRECREIRARVWSSWGKY